MSNDFRKEIDSLFGMAGLNDGSKKVEIMAAKLMRIACEIAEVFIDMDMGEGKMEETVDSIFESAKIIRKQIVATVEKEADDEAESN